MFIGEIPVNHAVCEAKFRAGFDLFHILLSAKNRKSVPGPTQAPLTGHGGEASGMRCTMSPLETRSVKILIGPLFIAHPPAAGPLPPEVTSLGTAIEWASPEGAVQIPLFRHRPKQTNRFRLEHVLVRSGDLPCDITCVSEHVFEASGIAYAPLEALVFALYNSETQRPIRDLLRDMASMIPLEAPPRRPAPAGALMPAAEESGFRLAAAARDGDEVLIELAWRPSTDANPLHVVNGALPSDGRDKGSWIESSKPGISALLARDLHRLFPGPPGGLMSGRGWQYLHSLPAAG